MRTNRLKVAAKWRELVQVGLLCAAVCESSFTLPTIFFAANKAGSGSGTRFYTEYCCGVLTTCRRTKTIRCHAGP